MKIFHPQISESRYNEQSLVAGGHILDKYLQ